MATSLLKNIAISKKLPIIILVPIFAMLVLAGLKTNALNKQAKSQSDLVELMSVSVAANNLVHEMQKERGFSAGYTKSKGKKFSDNIVEQRKVTDKKRVDLGHVLNSVDTARFGAEYNDQLKQALDDFKKIDTMRKQINDFHLPLPDVVSYYTNMNANFLSITKKTLFIVDDPAILRDISAYFYFMQSKERAGIERAIGAAGFGGGWNKNLTDKFASLISLQDTYLGVFLAYATHEEQQFYNDKAKKEPFMKVDAMRQEALGLKTPAVKTTAAEWFKTITAKINLLKANEDHLAQDVTNLAQTNADKALSLRNKYIGILTILSVFVALAAFIIISDLLRNIERTKAVMQELSSGNTDVEIIGTQRKDEIGGMARSIEVFKQGLIEKIALEEEALKTQAHAEEDKRQAMHDLAISFDSQVGSHIDALASASTELQATASSMQAISDETSQASQTVASSSEVASQNVNTVSAAMQEMAAASNEIASQITNARTQSNETAGSANNANETIGNLNELVANIGEVVLSIQDIAEQTNLLALNATIEAARAGEAGKGFAVVADEVKKLATETSKKTEEINIRITEIQTATVESVNAMGQIIKNISEIDHSVTGVSAAVEEQNATTGEIVRSVSEASNGVDQVSQIIIEVQRSAGETGSSAGDVLTAATEVAKLSELLKGSVTDFLDGIRSNDNNSVEKEVS